MLRSFREGVKWGFVLFCHVDEKSREMVKTLSDGRLLSEKKFNKEVDDGKWDDAFKNIVLAKIKK